MKFLIRLGLAAVVMLSACHSFHIDVAVENQTGAPVRLVEVDYPNASFGADSIAPGAAYHYRFQVQESGPIKVQYTAGDNHQFQITGPTLAERQEGTLQIVLLPNGKAEFHPHLSRGQ